MTDLPKVGDKITAVVKADDKIYVFSKDWHVVLTPDVLDEAKAEKAKGPPQGGPF